MSDGFTLAAIQPLVTNSRPQARTLMLTFTCPESKKHVQARWTGPATSAVTGAVTSAAKRTLWYEVRRNVSSMLYAVMGNGMAGRMASQVAYTAMNSAQTTSSTASRTLSQAEIETGTVEAFRSVSSQFVFTGGRWVHASAAGESMAPMQKQLHAAPLDNRYDQLLVARMMVEVAGAEGGISQAESDYLSDVLDPNLGSLDALTKRPPLTNAELGEASEGAVRVTMLTLVYTLALVDEDLAAAELEGIQRFAGGLGLSAAQTNEARDAARSFVLDQALGAMVQWGGHDQHARDKLIDLGRRIGMRQEEVELAEARYMKRSM